MVNASLDPPLAPPQLTKDEALEVARNDHWAESLFRHPLTVGYGSHDFSLTRDGRPVGRIDVWMITIREVFIPRPGGSSRVLKASRPPPVTTFTVYVDDKAGTIVMASGS